MKTDFQVGPEQRRGAMRRITRIGFRVALGICALMVSACSTDDLLNVDDPDVPGPTSLGGVEGLPVLLAGVVGDFHDGYIGPGLLTTAESSGQIGYSGLLGDEIHSGDTFISHSPIDQRNTELTNPANEIQFFRMSVARASADRVAGNYAELAPDSAGRALVLALSGFATVILGENYCSGVPFSSIDAEGSVITYGEPLPTSAIWARALSKFDTAASVAGITADVANLVAIGRGRAWLDSAQYEAAAAAVAGVPAGFTHVIESSANSDRETNGVWAYFNSDGRWTVADMEGTNGLPYRGANDPRVPFLDTQGPAFDGITPLFAQLKYPDRSSPVPLATAAEARLIEAEGALHGNDAAGFLDRLNAARAEFPGLLPLPADSIPLTVEGKVDLLFRERAFSLWLTSHRLGDMRRLVRQYGRDAGTVFPVGTWFKGPPEAPEEVTPYGTDVNLPLPQQEENNPLFHGCLDRNA